MPLKLLRRKKVLSVRNHGYIRVGVIRFTIHDIFIRDGVWVCRGEADSSQSGSCDGYQDTYGPDGILAWRGTTRIDFGYKPAGSVWEMNATFDMLGGRGLTQAQRDVIR